MYKLQVLNIISSRYETTQSTQKPNPKSKKKIMFETFKNYFLVFYELIEPRVYFTWDFHLFKYVKLENGNH